jgi:hypothetical protein
MEKSKLERFINKYNLGGACETVLLKSDGNTLSVRGISDDKNILEEISVANMNFPKGEFGVYDTKKLRAILSVLDESLTVNTQVTGDKVTALNMEDGSTKTTFVLADPSVIPPVPELKNNPSPNVVIKLDANFTSTFIKAKNALSEVETFAVSSSGDSNTATVIIGYSSINTNRIVLTANTETPSKMDPVLFSANYLKEILSANKEVTNGTLEISSKGLAKAHFDHDGTLATYYLVQVKS